MNKWMKIIMIKGLVLENFMSYKNAYISFKKGLNIICGPNGAGKSSILLAISIALGQTYTERAKKLSDLIRHGESEARITLILDDSIENKKIRNYLNPRKKDLRITRIIKKSGDYYYLVNGKPISKSIIINAFNKIGLNPNNMLIIMHQLMVGKFSLTSPQEKLKMLEEAIGFQSYREDVIDAKKRLEKMFDEEYSIIKMIESTKETYEFWKKEYEKFLYKKELELKLNNLKKELLWAKIKKREEKVKRINEKINGKSEFIEKLNKSLIKLNKKLDEVQKEFESLKNEIKDLIRLRIEEKSIPYESIITIKQELNKIKDEIKPVLIDHGLENIFLRIDSLSSMLKNYEEYPINLNKGLIEYEEKLNFFEKVVSELINTKVSIEVLLMKKELINEEIKNLRVQLRILEEELKPLLLEAKNLGSKVETERKIFEIMNEISIIEERLKPLAYISSDVEKAYASYADLYKSLNEKAKIVAKNKKELEEELKKRLAKWKQIMNEFLEKLSYKYNSILAEVNAKGSIKLIESNDIEKAGIEILVGFKGLKPRSLDSLTQSGGERSIALMAFLLALQQSILSPFRAIDEFDVHMDPRNREIISKLIFASAKSRFNGQYIVITPGQIHLPDENVHVIVVQSMNGSSIVHEVE